MQISFFKHTFNNETNAPVPVNFTSVLSGILHGKWKTQVEELRAIEDKKEYTLKKKHLPCATWSGTFTERLADKLIDYSGMMIVDIDNLDKQKMNTLRDFLRGDHYVTSYFVSPGGDGLKVLMKVDSAPENHITAFLNIESYFKENYKIDIDPSGKDVCRLCYVSYDPDMFYNAEARAFPVNLEFERDTQLKRDASKFIGKKVSTDVYYVFKVAVKWTERTHTFVEGNRNNYIHTLACTLNRCGISHQDALYLIDQNYVTPDTKWHQSVRSAYFHRKHEHNTIDVYKFEREEGPVDTPEEKVYSSNDLDNEIISKAVELFGLGAEVSLVRDLIASYASYIYNEYANEGDTIDDTKIRSIINAGHNAYRESRQQKKTQMFSLEDAAMEAMNQLFASKSVGIDTGIQDINDLLGGGLQQGNLYGLIGCEGTMKSLLAQAICMANIKRGYPSLYENGEMSALQFIGRLTMREFGVDIMKEYLANRLKQEDIPVWVEKLNKVLGGKLMIRNGKGFSCNEILEHIREYNDAHPDNHLRLVVVDGVSSMDPGGRDEIAADIHNALELKEVAKNGNVAIIVLCHTKTGVSKYIRTTGDYTRGGIKMAGNMDGYFATSLLVDPKTNDLDNDKDILYREGMFYVRFFDKRGGGQTVNKIIRIEQPLLLQPIDDNPQDYEVKLNRR